MRNGNAGQGIYLDENTSSALVENNLVYRTSAVGQAQTADHNRGRPNTIKKQTFLPTDVWAPSRKGCDPPVRESCNLLSPNNLIYFDMGYVNGICLLMGGSCTESEVLDNCTGYGEGRGLPAYQPYTTSRPGRSQVYVLRESLGMAECTGEDSGSVVQNPGFANPGLPGRRLFAPPESPGGGLCCL